MTEIGQEMAIKKEIPVAVRDKALKALMALPPKAPATEPVEVALQTLKPAIVNLLTTGYSRQDVIEKLGKEGVHVKMYQLKKLLASERKSKTE